MENNRNIDFLKQSLTTERTIIVPTFGALIITLGGWCALVQKESFNPQDPLTIIFLVLGIVISIGLVVLIYKSLQKINKLLNLLKN